MKNPVFQVIEKLEQLCDISDDRDAAAEDAKNRVACRLMEVAQGIYEGDYNCASISIVTDGLKLNQRKVRDEILSWTPTVTLERFDITPAIARSSKIVVSTGDDDNEGREASHKRVIDMVDHMEKLTEAFLDGTVDHPDLKESLTQTVTSVSKTSI